MKETCIKLKHENTDLVKRNVWGLADKIHVSTEQNINDFCILLIKETVWSTFQSL